MYCSTCETPKKSRKTCHGLITLPFHWFSVSRRLATASLMVVCQGIYSRHPKMSPAIETSIWADPLLDSSIGSPRSTTRFWMWGYVWAITTATSFHENVPLHNKIRRWRGWVDWGLAAVIARTQALATSRTSTTWSGMLSGGYAAWGTAKRL